LPLHEGRGRWALAGVLHRLGELEAAEREARAALDLLAMMPLDHAAVTATLAGILLSRGQRAEARRAAEEAMRRYEAIGSFGFRGTVARLVHIEALVATGDLE